jgi:hypothetical protein
VDSPGMRASRLAVILDEMRTLDAAALRTVSAGDRRALCEISERLMELHLRFAAEYRAMLATPP